MKTKLYRLTRLGMATLLSLSALLSVSIPAAHALQFCTWNGSDYNNGPTGSYFSDTANWDEGCDLTSGGTFALDFPSNGVYTYTPVDNIPNLEVTQIQFGGNGYHITSSSSQNVLTIDSGIVSTSSGAANEIDVNITLNGSQSFTESNADSELIVGQGSDTLNVGSNTLTPNTLTLANTQLNDPLAGSGSVVIQDSGYPSSSDGVDFEADSSGFTGSISIQQGPLFTGDNAVIPNVTVASGGILKGSGSVTTTTVQAGGTIAPGHSPGCLSVGNLTLSGTYTAQIGGTTACTDYDQLQASSANVGGGTLQVSLVNGFTPALGESFDILDNTGNNAVSGTFAGLPEGATFTSGGVTYQISYQGGDGNDVTLTVVNAPAGSASTAAAAPKAPDTGLAATVKNPLELFALTLILTLSVLAIARQIQPKKS